MFEYRFSPDKKTTICIFKEPKTEAKRLMRAACVYSNDMGSTGWNGVNHFAEHMNSTELFFTRLSNAILKKMPKAITAKTTLRSNDVYDEEEGKKIAKAKCLNKFYNQLEKIYEEEASTFAFNFDMACNRLEDVIDRGIERNRNKVIEAIEKNK